MRARPSGQESLIAVRPLLNSVARLARTMSEVVPLRFNLKVALQSVSWRNEDLAIVAPSGAVPLWRLPCPLSGR